MNKSYGPKRDYVKIFNRNLSGKVIIKGYYTSHLELQGKFQVHSFTSTVFTYDRVV